MPLLPQCSLAGYGVNLASFFFNNNMEHGFKNNKKHTDTEHFQLLVIRKTAASGSLCYTQGSIFETAFVFARLQTGT